MIRLTTLFSALAAVRMSFRCRCNAGRLTGLRLLARSGVSMRLDVSDPDPEMTTDYGNDACCGFEGSHGELVRSGNLYGSRGHHAGSLRCRYGHGYGGYYGSPDPRSFESGFENLPDMDGGGVHHRLPFHSYRRPWAHPGIADTNINIVW